MRVTVMTRPAPCRHVLLTAGGVSVVLTRDELARPLDDAERQPALVLLTRFEVGRYLRQNPNATPAQVVAYIEGVEF